MKKKLLVLFLVFIFIFCSACAEKISVASLIPAEEEIKSVTFYYRDSDTSLSRTNYSSDASRDLAAALGKASVKAADPEKLEKWSFPSYGLKIRCTDGSTRYISYCNGLLLLDDGSVYKAKIDFAALWDSPFYGVESKFGYLYSFPNYNILVNYPPLFWKKAEDPEPLPEGVSLTFNGYDGERVSVTLRNDSGGYINYGNPYELHQKFDGVWYNYPFLSLGFTLPLYVLYPGNEETTDMYVGELEAGEYRIVWSDRGVEFTVE